MMNKNTATTSLRALTIALNLAFGAGAALADSTATASLGNAQIKMTDLDATDGITPTLSIDFGSRPYLNGGIGSYGSEFLHDAYAHLGRNPASTLTDSVQAAYATSAATMVGADTVAGYTSMAVSGTASSGSLSFGEYGASASIYFFPTFTVSAHTAITISVDVTMNVKTTLGYDSLTGALEHSDSLFLMAFNGMDADNQSVHDDTGMELYVDAAYDKNGNIAGDQQTWSGTLSVTFSNYSAQDATGNFYTELSVGGLSIATPVPEPSSYALLLGGLGVVGSIARRRSAREG